MIFDSPGLGYVVATHQSLKTFIPETVWMYYWSLANATPREARTWLLQQDWPTLRDRALADLSRAHPDLADCVTRIDICRMGHAMIRPTPGISCLDGTARPARRLVRALFRALRSERVVALRGGAIPLCLQQPTWR